MKDSQNYINYDINFQCKLLALMLLDRPFFLKIVDIISPSHFNDDGISWFVSNIQKYHKEYKTTPTFDVLRVLISDIKDSNLKVLVNRTITKLVDFEDLKFDDIDFVKNHTLKYITKETLKKETDVLAIMLDDNTYSIDEIITQTTKLYKIPSLVEETSQSYAYKTTIDTRVTDVISRSPISTGMRDLDKLTGGGLGKKELGLIVAPPGVGKSWGLQKLAASALRDGYNVIYFTLELYSPYVGMRFDTIFTGIEKKYLEANKDMVETVISNLEGNLYIEYAPTKSMTVNGIRSILEKYQMNGINIDMVCVDYVDLLKLSSSSHKSEKRHMLEETYEELRGLAGEFDIPVWTASQANRGSLEKQYIDQDSIAEAFNKMNVVDFAISLQRQGENKNGGLGSAFIMKSRIGPDGITLLFESDFNKGYFNLLDKNTEEAKNIIINHSLPQEKTNEALKDIGKTYMTYKQNKKEE